LAVVEVAFLEADGADVKAAALLGELAVEALDRGILVGADVVGVAAQSEAYAFDAAVAGAVVMSLAPAAAATDRIASGAGARTSIGRRNGLPVQCAHSRRVQLVPQVVNGLRAGVHQALDRRRRRRRERARAPIEIVVSAFGVRTNCEATWFSLPTTNQ
jgi:hypothetical protein